MIYVGTHRETEENEMKGPFHCCYDVIPGGSMPKFGSVSFMVIYVLMWTNPIIGDFNIDPKRDAKEYRIVASALESKGFVQIINRPTHLKGHVLDHMYLRNIESFDWQLHHPYWTDHDATCLRVQL